MKRFDMSSILSVSVLIFILIVAGCAEIHQPTLDAEANFNRATAYIKEGHYDQAIDDYTKVIELNPRDAKAYAIRGFAYSDKGQHDKAIADFTRSHMTTDC